MTLHIDIASDIVCPWCYIGKRHLEQALELFAEEYPNADTPTIAWLPFQLNPDMPMQGMSRDEYVERKFGRPAHEVYERVRTAGEAVNLPFAFDSIERQPNTSLIGGSNNVIGSEATAEDEHSEVGGWRLEIGDCASISNLFISNLFI